MDRMIAPSCSIVIPARDEERHLPKCLHAIALASAKANIRPEVVVVLNRCSDNTERIARDFTCKIAKDDSKNLAAIRNTGVRASTGEVVVTIDADSQMSEGMMVQVLKKLSDPRVVGGGVVMIPERWSIGIALTLACLLPIAVWYRISGGLFYFRREDFDKIGGFDEKLFSVEDIDFAKRLSALGRASGRRFRTIFRAYLVTSCRKFDKLGDWYFLRHPVLFVKLLRGGDSTLADPIWYDFPR